MSRPWELEEALKRIVIGISQYLKPVPEIHVERKTLDQIIDECQKPLIQYEMCKHCSGIGFWRMEPNSHYAEGPQEFECNPCNGLGKIKRDV